MSKGQRKCCNNASGGREEEITIFSFFPSASINFNPHVSGFLLLSPRTIREKLLNSCSDLHSASTLCVCVYLFVCVCADDKTIIIIYSVTYCISSHVYLQKLTDTFQQHINIFNSSVCVCVRASELLENVLFRFNFNLLTVDSSVLLTFSFLPTYRTAVANEKFINNEWIIVLCVFVMHVYYASYLYVCMWSKLKMIYLNLIFSAFNNGMEYTWIIIYLFIAR